MSKQPHPFLDNPIRGIAASATLGFLLAMLAGASLATLCEGSETFACDATSKSPPWLLLSAIAAAPSVLLTWYWRDVGRRTTETHKQDDIDTATKNHVIDRDAKLAAMKRAEESYALERDAKVASRFLSVAPLLTEEKTMSRVIGLHALWDIAKDSPGHRQTISQSLAAFVRVGAAVSTDSNYYGDDDFSPPPPDIQVALSLLFHPLWDSWLPERQPDIRSTDLMYSSLEGVDLANADMRNANLAQSNLSASRLRKANLSGTNLFKASLRDCVIDGATMSGTVLSSADLSNASLLDADLSGANLKDSTMVSSRLSGARLVKAELNGADLEDSIAEGADFTQADLRQTKLFNASLSGSEFRGANLTKADLRAVRT